MYPYVKVYIVSSANCQSQILLCLPLPQFNFSRWWPWHCKSANGRLSTSD